MAHEAGKHNDKIIPYAVDIKRYNGDIMLQAAQGDIGRGIMDNVDDDMHCQAVIFRCSGR